MPFSECHWELTQIVKLFCLYLTFTARDLCAKKGIIIRVTCEDNNTTSTTGSIVRIPNYQSLMMNQQQHKKSTKQLE